MARKTNKQKLAARQDTSTPALFGEDGLPVRADLVEAIVQGRHKHTGERLLENHEHVGLLVELLLQGMGVDRIAKRMGVSKWSVIAARDALVARGEMAGWKERIARRSELAVEDGLAAWHEGVLNGSVKPAQIPIGLGIIFDKRQLAMGEATAISGTAAVADPSKLSVDRLNSALQSLEAQSIGQAPEPKQIKAAPALEAGLVAGGAGPEAERETVPGAARAGAGAGGVRPQGGDEGPTGLDRTTER